MLASLVRLQRGSFAQEVINSLPAIWQEKAEKIVVLLRLSVLLHRSRNYRNYIEPKVTVEGKAITLSFSDEFYKQHPLTYADLENEKRFLNQAGYQLIF